MTCDTKCIVTRLDRCQAAAWLRSIDMYIDTEHGEYDTSQMGHIGDWRLKCIYIWMSKYKIDTRSLLSLSTPDCPGYHRSESGLPVSSDETGRGRWPGGDMATQWAAARWPAHVTRGNKIRPDPL